MNAGEQDEEYHWEMNEYGLQTVVKSPSANKTKSSATAAASLNPSKVATSEMQRPEEIEHGIPKTSKDNEKAQPATSIALDVNNNESVRNPVGSKASSPAIQMNNAIEMINHARDASSSGNASGSESNSSLYDEAKDETKINVVRRRNKNTAEEAKIEIGETTTCEASTIKVVVDDQKKINSVVSKTKHFPVSSSNIGCCACLKRLCCHGLTDTDDLILRRERERLNKHLDKEDEVLSGQDKCMMVLGEAFMSVVKFPKCDTCCCQHPAIKWTTFVFQILIISWFVLSTQVLPYVLRALCVDSSLLRSTSANEFHCSSVQEQLKHSQYTQNITGYAGLSLIFLPLLFGLQLFI